MPRTRAGNDTDIRLRPLYQDNLGKPATERLNQSGL